MSLYPSTYRFIFTWLISFVSFQLFAKQTFEQVQQFEKIEYAAASQNWSVSTSNNGYIYFANHQGLLQFDGVSWKLHSLPNKTILRDVEVISDSLIYTGGYLELGYWKPDKLGKLEYYSLVEEAAKFFPKNTEFWNIESKDQTVYFRSFGLILAHQSDSIFQVKIPGYSSLLSKVDDRILIAVSGKGIYEVLEDSTRVVVNDPLFEGKFVRFMLPYEDDKIMIGTSSHGIFIYDGSSITPWNKEWTDYFVENNLNRAHISKSGKIAIGTILNGIIIFDSKGKLLHKINSDNGLPNNTVLGIDSDPWDNIWLALDNGIGFISKDQEKSYSIEEIPNIGAIYSAVIHQGYLYLGTNQGLFARPADSSTGSFHFIPNTQGQVWNLSTIENQLFAGHNDGTFVIEGLKASIISTHSGGAALIQDTKGENQLIQSTYSNLVSYKKNQHQFELNTNIAGFYDLIRYLEIDHLGNLWASHMHRGIFQLYLDDTRDKIVHEKYFGEKAFGKDHSIHVFKVENRIVFTTNDKLYTFDDLKDSIVPFHSLNKQLKKYSKAHRIIAAPNHHYWFISKNDIGLFKIEQDQLTLIHEYPTMLFRDNPMVDDFENILPLSETKAILCLQNGIAHLNADVNDSTLLIQEFTPVLQEFRLHNNRANTLGISINSSHVTIKHNYNNIDLRFSFPFFTASQIHYQYHLNGIYSDWSEKLDEPIFEFERLPAGEYELLVKAVDLWDNESQIYQLAIEVLPPWYSSSTAKVFYFILLISILIGFRSWGIRQTKKKIEKQQEKKEQELVKLRNDKLRNEVSHKSKELANSTMSIIKKNEFLLNLKKILLKQKEELGSRYPDKYFNHLSNKIEENISSHDDWQLFETNFERAHEQFLNKIKEDFPELTSKDLRLCAYLRMNLSSKEIAPLLGISVRGVENHRYRLRKKMKLEHDEKLIDMIIKL